MNRALFDADRAVDGDSDFAGPGIAGPAVDLGWKAGFAGLAVGLFGAKFYWARTVPRWPTIFAITAAYGMLVSLN